MLNNNSFMFLVAKQLIGLTLREQLAIGSKLKILNFNHYLLDKDSVEELLFKSLYRQNRLIDLMIEINQVKRN